MTKPITLLIAVLAVVLAVVVTHQLAGADESRTQGPAATRPAGTPAQLWTCGMHPQVVQDHPGNCPICHMKLVPMRKVGGGGTADGKGKVLYWWDPMIGPASISDKPGKSAMGMDLVPVYEGQQSAGPGVVIDPTVVQNMGVRTAVVTRGPLTRSVRTVGVFREPETGLHDVNLRVGGWIEKLYANQEGIHVHKGDPLFDLYSPDVVVAEEELVGAVKAVLALPPDAAEAVRREAESLVASAKRKLLLMDVPEREIAAVAEQLVVPRTVTFRSPSDGAIVDKAVVEGSAVQAGVKLMRVEDHSTMWLDVQVYEDQMPVVALGDQVEATVEALPGETFAGTIGFLYPHLDHMSRTVTARVNFDNPGMKLRPGMYAAVRVLGRPVSDVVQVPREAVIDTGTRQIAFVAGPEGHFDPRRVRTGLVGDDGRVQVLEGFAPGETVVTSGQFLLDVESRTTEAIEKMRGGGTVALAAGPEPGQPAVSPTQPVQGDAARQLVRVYCPMKKTEWLQQGDQVANPFFGSEMRDCGEARGEVAVPAKRSPLSAVVDAYVQVGKGLASDTLDAKAMAALRAAAEKLPDQQFAALRQHTLALADARDIGAARAAFQTVSGDVIGAVAASANSSASRPSAEAPRP